MIVDHGTGDQLNVTLADGKLFGERTGLPKREYLPVTDTIFYANSSAAIYVFVRDKQGAVQPIEMLVFGNVLSFKRVN